VIPTNANHSPDVVISRLSKMIRTTTEGRGGGGGEEKKEKKKKKKKKKKKERKKKRKREIQHTFTNCMIRFTH
jgi:hypothetical protein